MRQLTNPVVRVVSSAIAIAAVCQLVACTPKQQTVITTPLHVETERLVVEPIPAELKRTFSVAEGPLSECPTVAAQRKAELLACMAVNGALIEREEKR